MSDDRYNLRWKGKILGPFSRRQIERKIQDHELGMLHEIWNENHWITLREFLGEQKDFSSKSEIATEANESMSANHPASAKALPPPVWLMSGYITLFLLLILGMLGWTQTWIAPWGWAPLLGLGLGLVGGLFGLLTYFQGEKKHGMWIVIFSVILAFGNMMLV